MTQHLSRKLADYGPVKQALAQLHEPPIVSAIYGSGTWCCLGLACTRYFTRRARLRPPGTSSCRLLPGYSRWLVHRCGDHCDR